MKTAQSSSKRKAAVTKRAPAKKSVPVGVKRKAVPAKKPVAKKPVAKKPEAKKPEAKKPATKKASSTRATTATKKFKSKPKAKTAPARKAGISKKATRRVAAKSVRERAIAKKPALKKVAAKKTSKVVREVAPAKKPLQRRASSSRTNAPLAPGTQALVRRKLARQVSTVKAERAPVDAAAARLQEEALGRKAHKMDLTPQALVGGYTGDFALDYVPSKSPAPGEDDVCRYTADVRRAIIRDEANTIRLEFSGRDGESGDFSGEVELLRKHGHYIGTSTWVWTAEARNPRGPANGGVLSLVSSIEGDLLKLSGTWTDVGSNWSYDACIYLQRNPVT